MRRYGLTLLVVLLIASTTFAQDAPILTDLRPLWQTGQTATYRATTTRKTRTSVEAGEHSRSGETQIAVNADVTWRVTEANEDGGGTGEMIIDDITLTITGMNGQTSTADGRGAGGEKLKSLDDLLGAMRGVVVTVNVDSTGHISSVSGWETIKNNAGKMGDTLEERDFVEMATDLAWLVGGQAGMKPGSQWDEQFNWSHEAGDLLHDSQYTFEGVEEIAGVPVAMVTRRSKLRLNPKMPDGAPPVDVRITGAKQQSQIMFDLSRHEVVGQHIDRNLTAQISMNIGPRTITTTIDEHVSTQLLRTSEK